MIAVLLAGGALVSPAAAENPFDALVKDGKEVCFRRVYDAEHLKKNPRQQVTSMTVWITGKQDAMRSGNTGLALTRRGEVEPLFLSGGCEWQNFENPPETWMPTFKKQAGADCVTTAVPDVFEGVSSAEEGGPVILDPAPDGKTLMVHLDGNPSACHACRALEGRSGQARTRRSRLQAPQGRSRALCLRQGGSDYVEPPHEPQ